MRCSEPALWRASRKVRIRYSFTGKLRRKPIRYRNPGGFIRQKCKSLLEKRTRKSVHPGSFSNWTPGTFTSWCGKTAVGHTERLSQTLVWRRKRRFRQNPTIFSQMQETFQSKSRFFLLRLLLRARSLACVNRGPAPLAEARTAVFSPVERRMP